MDVISPPTDAERRVMDVLVKHGGVPYEARIRDFTDEEVRHGKLAAADEQAGAANLAYIRELLAAGQPEPLAQGITVPRTLLESLVDEDDCRFDHDGGCQAHGYLALEPGEKCPQAELKDLLQL